MRKEFLDLFAYAASNNEEVGREKASRGIASAPKAVRPSFCQL